MARQASRITACGMLLGMLALGGTGGRGLLAAAPGGELRNWIYVLDVGRGTLREVAAGPAGFQANHCFSPDGRKVVAQRGSGRDSDLWQIDLTSGRETRLTDGPAQDGRPAYSPDGRWIAFDRKEPGGKWNIWVMRADGSGQRPVTDDAEAALIPVWAPDGKRLLCESARDGGIPQLYGVNVDGTGLRQLTADAAGGPSPRWSHDGRRVCYVSFQEGWRDLSVVDVASGARRRVTRGPEIERFACWSSDDRRLLVTRSLPQGGASRIYLLEPEAGKESLLAEGYAIGWSPDDRRIFLMRDGDIWVMNADGSGQQPLTTHPAGTGGYWHPILSADCRQMITGRTGFE